MNSKKIAEELIDVADKLVVSFYPGQSQINSNVKQQIKKGLMDFVNDMMQNGKPKFPVPIIEIDDIKYDYQPEEREDGHTFVQESLDLDDYKVRFRKYYPGDNYRYDEFLKKYCNLDWSSLSKSDKSIVQHTIDTAWGTGKWIKDIFMTVKVEGDIHTEEAEGQALMYIEVKKDTFSITVHKAQLYDKTLEGILEEVEEGKWKSRNDGPDGPDDDYDDYDDPRADYIYQPY